MLAAVVLRTHPDNLVLPRTCARSDRRREPRGGDGDGARDGSSYSLCYIST
eukprot:COSAG05_NODE_13334_length_434_cov_0.764179_1_plen_50_part_10